MSKNSKELSIASEEVILMNNHQRLLGMIESRKSSYKLTVLKLSENKMLI